MLTNATKRKIDTARDILVGKIPVPTSQVEQITLALVYKFMSDMDKKAKDLGDSSGFFANGYEKYSWGKLMDKALPARERVLLYREALEKMSLNPHIPQLFRDVFRDASLPFNDPETLKLFLDVIDQFEYDHSEELGNAFEYLLQVMGSQGDAGQFRTPRHIIDFIVDVVEPSKTDKILDPACGTAGFLISAYNHIKKKGLSSDEMTQLSENFVGYDISQDMQRLSLVNLYLHHFPNPHIFEYDTLSSEDRWNDNFDVILANPPFMTPKGGIRPHNRFSVPSKRAEVLFVDYIMEHLTARGKAGVIVPEGIIFQSQNAYKQLRKMMVEENYLWAVVSLPGGVFNPYSGVKTSILLFDREIAKKTDHILFVKIENDGFDLGAQRRESDKNDLPVAQELLLKYKKSILNGKKLSIDEVLELGGSTSDKKLMSSYGFDLDANSHIELSQLINKAYSEVSKDSIINSDFSLSSERYVDQKLGVSSSYGLEEIGELVETITPPAKLHKSEYLSKGNFPIIDQSLVEIAGYTNDSNKVIFTQNPLVIFGDHTCIAKYIDEAFAQGADGIKILKCKSDLVPKYLYYTLKYKPIESDGYSRHFSKLKRYAIPLPPVQIQEELADELDRYQKIIDGARQVVENYLPSFTIDKSWEWEQLDKLADFRYGYTTSAKMTGEARFVRITDIGQDGLLKNEDKKFIELNEESKEYLLKNNDILVARTGATFGKTLLFESSEPSIFASYLIQIILNHKLLPRFYWAFAQTQEYWNQAKRLVTGGAQPQFNANVIKKILVPIPPRDIQEKIALSVETELKQISAFRDVIKNFENKIDIKISEVWNK